MPDDRKFDVVISAFRKDGTVEQQRIPMNKDWDKAEVYGKYLAEEFKKKFPEYQSVQSHVEESPPGPPMQKPGPVGQGT